MADYDYLKKRAKSPIAKKILKKYGKDFYVKMGLKGWEKRQDMMLSRAGRYSE